MQAGKFKPFLPNVPFLSLLETPENQTFSDGFVAYWNGVLEWNIGLKRVKVKWLLHSINVLISKKQLDTPLSEQPLSLFLVLLNFYVFNAGW